MFYLTYTIQSYCVQVSLDTVTPPKCFFFTVTRIYLSKKLNHSPNIRGCLQQANKSHILFTAYTVNQIFFISTANL